MSRNELWHLCPSVGMSGKVCRCIFNVVKENKVEFFLKNVASCELKYEIYKEHISGDS